MAVAAICPPGMPGIGRTSEGRYSRVGAMRGDGDWKPGAGRVDLLAGTGRGHKPWLRESKGTRLHFFRGPHAGTKPWRRRQKRASKQSCTDVHGGRQARGRPLAFLPVWFLAWLVPLVLLFPGGCGTAGRQTRTDVVLATTTSAENSGLLDVILPDFTARTGIRVKVVAVGSGQALALARRGDADIVLSHAPAEEERLVSEGHGLERRVLMHGDFVILGPGTDPAGIKGMRDAAAALARVARSGALFVSRGDDSGTHARERALWEAAGVPPEGPWYISAGAGMSATLRLAAEKGAYTLSDRATYLMTKGRLADLTVLVEGDGRLRNPYAVIAVNPGRHPRVNHAGAVALITYLFSPEGQEAIANFGRAETGQPVFTPVHPGGQ